MDRRADMPFPSFDGAAVRVHIPIASKAALQAVKVTAHPRFHPDYIPAMSEPKLHFA
jgi:hypothetical protein